MNAGPFLRLQWFGMALGGQGGGWGYWFFLQLRVGVVCLRRGSKADQTKNQKLDEEQNHRKKRGETK